MSRTACLRHRKDAPSEKAWLFYPPENPEVDIWIPRSVCTHRSQLETERTLLNSDGGHEHPLTKITVEEWWVAKNPHYDKYFS